MKQHTSLSGIFPVVPTPLLDDESFDARGMRRLTDYYMDAGCHGLVVLGSGGELPYFTGGEKITILKTVVDAVRDRVPVIAGCGYVSLAETLDFMDITRSMDIEAYMVILPTYFPIPFQELYAFYRTVGKISPKPVIYYHYPQITGHFLETDQMKQLLMLDGIVGVKESTMCLPEIGRHIRSMTEKPIRVFTGTTLILRQVLAQGGAGAICPIAGIAPRLVTECYRAYTSGDETKARGLQDDIRSFVPLMNTFGLPVGLQKLAISIIARKNSPSPTAGRYSRHAVMKETLRQLGHSITSRVRSPLPQITPEERDAISAFIDGMPCLARERV
jgi:dihydrodipicolinate synthase/N-acetylneuraminate lyase